MENVALIKTSSMVKDRRTEKLKEMLAKFQKYLDVRPQSMVMYINGINKFINFLAEIGEAYPTRSTVLRFRDEVKKKKKPTTVNNYLAGVRAFFEWTGQERLYPNIATRVKGAKIGKEHKKDYMTAEQIREMFSAIELDSELGRRDYAMIATMVTCGLRDVEIHRANIEDLYTVGKNLILFVQGKGQDEKSEYVKITGEVAKAIKNMLADRRETFGGKEPLFASQSRRDLGQRLLPSSISKIVKARLRKAGFDSERITAHSLRHTAVTLSLLGGRTLQEVQQFARHSHISTTQMYAHNLDRAKNMCEETISGAIFC